MTTVTLYLWENLIAGFRCEGHADAGTYGEDVVCAGISMITQTAVEAIHRLGGVSQGEMALQMEEGYLVLPPNRKYVREPIQTVLKTLEIGLELLVESYAQHIMLKREVYTWYD